MTDTAPRLSSLPAEEQRRALVRFRQARGWSQAKAAQWYGVTPRSWQRYEAGDRPIPMPLLNRIRFTPEVAHAR